MTAVTIMSGFRRLKTRLRRFSMTNVLLIVLAFMLTMFILSMLTGHRRSLNMRFNAPARLRARPVDQISDLPDTFGDGNDESQGSNQIDEPELTTENLKSTVSIYRDGVLGNYELFVDTTLSRPGDNGSKFDIENVDDVDLAQVEDLKQEYGINMAASKLIPMDRVVPDIRHPECKYWHYPSELPTASVVIVFHNEGLTTLMRTVHSVLVRSPRKLVREVLLIDDCSNKKDLGHELEQYISEHFGTFEHNSAANYLNEEANKGETLDEKSGKVRLLRNEERQGLINSRTRGAKAATGDVVVFLDAHCEVNQNWLPPLLAPIAKNRRTLTVPIIDGIDSVNFEYKPVYTNNEEHFRGIWEWGMLYKEIGLNMSEHMKTHRISEPYDSPTHAGGLFAIDRRFFAQLGYYDPGLLVWGGENFELSFKVWQCGGKLKWVPCSRVGHIYRPFMPYSFGTMANKRKGPLVLTNYKRVVEVWFDDAYKEYFYTREPLARSYDPGDITEQLELKKRLKCKSFDWFMTNVASDVFRDYPRLPKNLEWGEVRLKGADRCLDAGSSQPPQKITISGCHSSGGNQLFRLNKAGQLGVGERCINADPSKVFLDYCRLGEVKGPWRRRGNFLIHKKSRLCLTYDNTKLHLAMCNLKTKPDNQQWIWRKVEPSSYEDD